MTIFNPWALAFLLAIPVITVLYLLKQKHSDYTVSSLYLWNEVVKNIETSTSWRKLRKNLLMFLQIFAAALLALALSKPYLNMGKENANTVVMLMDTSLSMQATDIKPSRFEAAKKQALNIISDLQPGTKVTLVTMDANVLIRENLCSDKSRLLNTIAALQTTNGGTDFEEAAALVRSVIRQYPGSETYILGDRPLNVAANDIRTFNFSDKGSNYAVTLLSHTATGNGFTALSRIADYSDKDAALPVSLYVNGKIFDAKKIDVKAHEAANVYWDGIPGSASTLECRIDSEDSLDADNRAWDPVNTKKESKVLLVSDKNIFIEKAMALIQGTKLFKMDKNGQNSLKGYDLYILDGYMPETLPQDGSILLFNPPQNKYFTVDGEIPVYTINPSSHKLFHYIDSDVFLIDKAKKMKVPQWGEAVLKSGDNPLIMAGSLENKRIVIFGFDLHQSDITLTPVFPILMSNCMEWLLPSGMESIGNIAPGQPVELNISPKAELVRVTAPSGDTFNLTPPFSARLFDLTDETGIYTLAQKLPDELLQQCFAVNTTNELESDLASGSEYTWGSSGSGSSGIAQPPKNINLQPILIWGILLLLFLEWGVYRYDV